MRTSVALLLGLAGFGFSLLLRNEGMPGDYTFSLHWRWSQTPEAVMPGGRKPDAAPPVKRLAADRLAADQTAAALANPEWPGFRGTDRAARSRGPEISTNWTAQPPQQIWKIPVGPGWSSSAAAGRLIFTQEQRGPKEAVVCYEADTGREVWVQQLEARLDDPMGGPGPRATPTLAEGGLFVAGATGHVLRLNPLTGAIVWKQNLKEIAGRAVPTWGLPITPSRTASAILRQ